MLDALISVTSMFRVPHEFGMLFSLIEQLTAFTIQPVVLAFEVIGLL